MEANEGRRPTSAKGINEEWGQDGAREQVRHESNSGNEEQHTLNGEGQRGENQTCDEESPISL